MFDNTELLEAMSRAARAGTPGLETHPDYVRRFVPLSARPHDEREAFKDRANQCGPTDARTVPFDTGKPHGPLTREMAAVKPEVRRMLASRHRH